MYLEKTTESSQWSDELHFYRREKRIKEMKNSFYWFGLRGKKMQS